MRKELILLQFRQFAGGLVPDDGKNGGAPKNKRNMDIFDFANAAK